MKSKTRRGFTLIELLVVIAIISMLASMLMPVYSKAREKARQTMCVSNQHQVSLAIMMWTTDHDESLPVSETVWSELLSNEGLTESVLVCPTKGKTAGNGYLYNNAISGLALGDIPNPVRTLETIDGIHDATNNPLTYNNILYTALDVDRRHNDHAVCSFIDGHVGLDTEVMGFDYLNDFEQPVGGEWSSTQRDTTPTGTRQFLGQFANDIVTLTLNGLPDHEKITAEFDLYLLRAWEGNTTPHLWEFKLRGGQVLLHTTFALDPASPGQAYPGVYPGVTNPPRTNAKENDTLGYLSGSVSMDAVYHLSYTFDHSGGNLQLIFDATGLTDVNVVSWGLDNVHISGE